MTDSEELDRTVRQAAAERAAEGGMEAAPESFEVRYQFEGSVPGAEVFVASCPKQPVGSFTVTGLAVRGGEVLTGPQAALTKAFELWASEGSSPDPTKVAQVANALYGAAHRNLVALDDDSLERVREGVAGEQAQRVHLPRMIEIKGRPGVELWWRAATGVSRVRFYLDDRGVVATDQVGAADAGGAD